MTAQEHVIDVVAARSIVSSEWTELIEKLRDEAKFDIHHETESALNEAADMLETVQATLAAKDSDLDFAAHQLKAAEAVAEGNAKLIDALIAERSALRKVLIEVHGKCASSKKLIWDALNTPIIAKQLV